MTPAYVTDLNGTIMLGALIRTDASGRDRCVVGLQVVLYRLWDLGKTQALGTYTVNLHFQDNSKYTPIPGAYLRSNRSTSTPQKFGSLQIGSCPEFRVHISKPFDSWDLQES